MSPRAPQSDCEADSLVVPVAQETLSVSKEAVETGRIHVTTTTERIEQRVDTPVTKEEVSVRRVPVGRVVDVRPEIRQEGDVVVIPVLEEVLVVEKRLMLREEIHITTRRQETVEPQTFTLRKQTATIERVGPENADSPEAARQDSPRASTGE